jgi:proton glutamate symport protein
MLWALGLWLGVYAMIFVLAYLAGGVAHGVSDAGPLIALRLVGLALIAVYCRRRRSLTPWILWSMLAGVEYGLDLPHAALASRVFSDIFLRLIKCIVAPLIFGTLVTGVAGHGKAANVGRVGVKSLIYFEILTSVALVIGLVAINVSHAGAGLQMLPAHPPAGAAPATEPLDWQQFLLHVFPDNIAKAVADDQILEVAIFALLFGLALGKLCEERRTPMLRLIESLTETMFAFTNIVMYYAPVAWGRRSLTRSRTRALA